MFGFSYKGGTQVQDNKTYKFLAVVLDPPDEMFLYDALKKSMVYKDHDAMALDSYRIDMPTPYTTSYPYIKLFTAQNGFGLQKKYVSFYVMLTNLSDTIIRINPFGHESIQSGKYFEARGKLLSPLEIEALVSEQAYMFYQKQTYLSRQELSEMVQVKPISPENSSILSEVRKLRF